MLGRCLGCSPVASVVSVSTYLETNTGLSRGAGASSLEDSLSVSYSLDSSSSGARSDTAGGGSACLFTGRGGGRIEATDAEGKTVCALRGCGACDGASGASDGLVSSSESVSYSSKGGIAAAGPVPRAKETLAAGAVDVIRLGSLARGAAGNDTGASSSDDESEAANAGAWPGRYRATGRDTRSLMGWRRMVRGGTKDATGRPTSTSLERRERYSHAARESAAPTRGPSRTLDRGPGYASAKAL